MAAVRGEILGLGEGERFAVSTTGDLAIFDSFSCEIVVTDSLGHVVAKFGREGEGPGEIGYAEDLVFVADSMIAFRDVRNERLSLFRKDGTFLDERRIEQVIRTGIAHAPGGVALKTTGAWSPQSGGTGFEVVLLPIVAA